MSESNEHLWTISELAAEVATVLSAAEIDQSSGRVTDVPSTRTIRYYSTHGLLDRPTEFRGRTALYGRRHLLQLVAIKRLQARGTPLTEIQERLIGASEEELEQLAEIETEADEGQGETPAPKQARPSARSEDFWAQPVSEPEPAESDAALLERVLTTFPAIRLADGITLTLDGAERDVYPDDLEAIRVAAEPLVKLLKRRNLITD
jgi:DNA-binding transcriptional MerR regulator